MENKYFTPKISDCHVGYECEVYEPVLDNTEDYMEWVGIKIDENFNFQDYHNCERIRTPYLTKEQIENEGWTLTRNDNEQYFEFKLKDYGLGYWSHNNPISPFYTVINDDKFDGKITNINDFRILMKFLGI